MSRESVWIDGLKAFFAQRAEAISAEPSLRELCFVSGRDPRIWSDEAVYGQLVSSIISMLDVDLESDLLEVGCAAGYLAKGLSKGVRRYTGVDLVAEPLAVARRLGLTNASFHRIKPASRKFKHNQFDGVLFYDVITNYPTFDEAVSTIEEMLRFVKPGKRVLIGSIPDAAKQTEFQERVAEVSAELNQKYGELDLPPTESKSKPIWRKLFQRASDVERQILCYYFYKQDFLSLGERLGVEAQILNVQSLNPYAEFRFNVVYTKPSR